MMKSSETPTNLLIKGETQRIIKVYTKREPFNIHDHSRYTDFMFENQMIRDSRRNLHSSIDH